jgi:nicotinamidase-related amidase
MATEQKLSEQTWRVLGDENRDHYRISETSVDMTRPAVKPLPAMMKAQPQDIVIDLRKTALIVVDMQNDFCSHGGWFDTLGADVSPVKTLYPAITRVVTAMRSKDVPVIWLNWGVRADRANLSPVTRYAFNRVGCGTGLGDPVHAKGQSRNAPHGVLQAAGWGAAVVDELGARPDDIFVDKQRISGFWDTPLDSILRNLNVKTLLFTGINSDECVLATLMDANFHGYDTVLVEDCTATGSPDYCHQATLYNVRFCFGFTVVSSDLVSGIARSA